MDNYINYYYELYPGNIIKNGENYTFVLNNEKYYLIPYIRNMDELDILVRLNKEMIERGSLVHEIILNKDKKAVILINDMYYSLLRVYINESKNVDLMDIVFMLNNNDGIINNNILSRTNWSKLWEEKIDYFEYHIGHLIKKYLYIYKTTDYYIGLGENAISYYKNVEGKGINSPISVSHKRINYNSTLFDLYNPFNLIIDYKVRDIGEYIKDAFFNEIDVYKIIDDLFKIYRFDNSTLELLYSRLLFPSYYFDLYENILEKDMNENVISTLIKKSSKYEDLLRSLSILFGVTKIDWIVKRQII